MRNGFRTKLGGGLGMKPGAVGEAAIGSAQWGGDAPRPPRDFAAEGDDEGWVRDQIVRRDGASSGRGRNWKCNGRGLVGCETGLGGMEMGMGRGVPNHATSSFRAWCGDHVWRRSRATAGGWEEKTRTSPLMMMMTAAGACVCEPPTGPNAPRQSRPMPGSEPASVPCRGRRQLWLAGWRAVVLCS